MACECGCGYEGEDEVAQFLLEEALDERVRWEERKEQEREFLRAQAADAKRRATEKLKR